MELPNFRVQNNVNISQEKLGYRVVQVKKSRVHGVHVHAHFKPPEKRIQKHWEPPFKLCLEKACLPCSPPSSALVMGSFSLGSPIVDMHRVKTRLGTGVPRSPESDAPRSSLYPPLHFHCNQLVPATCSAQYFKSASVVARGINRSRKFSVLEVRTHPFFADLTCAELKVHI